MTGAVVDVWIAGTGALGDRDSDALAALCDAREHERAQRMPRADQSRRWLAVRGAVRALLADYLGIRAEDVALRREPSGKPRLGGEHADLRFNVSHSHDVAAVAVAVGREVGIDVELCDRGLDIDVIARRMFPADEAARLRGLPEDERRAAFYRSWSRREAWVKADGSGLRHPMHRLRVPDSQTPSFVPLLVPGAPGWAVADVRAPDGYVAAVAAAGDDWRAVAQEWRIGVPVRA